VKSLGTIIPRLAAAAFLLTIIAPCALAQSDDSDDEREGCEGTVGLERVRCESGKATPEAALLLPEVSGLDGESRLPVAQISKDLDYLQAATGRLSQLASQSGELDFKAVARLASGIRNRAARLEESLALPRTGKAAARGEGRGEGEVPSEPAQLRAALSTLSAMIAEVVRNPVLRGYVMDVPRAARARGRLGEIIALSERIRESSKPAVKGRR